MIRRADSLPPFMLALSAVAMATGAVLFPYMRGAFPPRLSEVHVSAADVAFSAVLAVAWLYAASMATVQSDRTMRQVVLAKTLKSYVPVTALFAIYIVICHPSFRPFRTTFIFLLSALLCHSLWAFFRSVSTSTSRRALVLGTGRLATTVWRDLRTGRLPDLSFVGFAGERYREEYCPDIAARYVGDISELKDIVLEQSVDDLIVATAATEGSAETERAVEVAANLGVRVWAVRQALGVPDYAARNNAANYIELVGTPGPSSIRCVAKRAFDLALSASALIMGLPIAVLALSREKAHGRKICLDREVRVGLHRHSFQIRRVHSEVASDWLCELMNKYLLMWNVFRGDMSMVGPRALSPEDLADREIPESMGRFGIRPGLTGGRECEGDRNLHAAKGHGMDYAKQRPLTADLVVLYRATRAFVQRNITTHLETGAL